MKEGDTSRSASGPTTRRHKLRRITTDRWTLTTAALDRPRTFPTPLATYCSEARSRSRGCSIRHGRMVAAATVAAESPGGERNWGSVHVGRDATLILWGLHARNRWEATTLLLHRRRGRGEEGSAEHVGSRQARLPERARTPVRIRGERPGRSGNGLQQDSTNLGALCSTRSTCTQGAHHLPERSGRAQEAGGDGDREWARSRPRSGDGARKQFTREGVLGGRGPRRPDGRDARRAGSRQLHPGRRSRTTSSERTRRTRRLLPELHLALDASVLLTV